MTLREQAQAISIHKQQIDAEIEALKPELQPYFRALVNQSFFKNQEEPERIDFDDSGVHFLFEYNEACGCHPEYHEQDILLTFEELDLTPQELEVQLAERKRQAQLAIKKAEKETKEKERQAHETRERAYYEKLKEKYENGHASN